MRRTLTALGALVIVLAGLTAGTGTAGADPTIHPVRGCAELVRDYAVPNAPTHVTAAEVREATGEPRHCLVTGHVEPAVGFRLKLPLDTYTGRYLQLGCGGLCGAYFGEPFPECVPHGGDVAVAATDDGHTGRGDNPFVQITDGIWAANNQAARDDYFFRAPHVVSLAAKRIIAAFYGAAPRHAYFDGCSTGGREGLLLAQRYPHDFDGIIAGATAHAMGPLFGVYFTWLSRTLADGTGAPVFSPDKLRVLHNAVVAACDRLDGLADGAIEDPRACRFDPARIQCPAGAGPDCLTAAQVATARTLYAGPVDDRGRRLYPGWESRGSELAWEGLAFLAPLPDNYLRHVGYPIGTPHSSLAEFPFTVAGLNGLTREGVKGNAMSLDLSAFRRAGGKLILWHGWDDQSIPAVGTVDYYARLSARNGGLRETQRFARLFLVPTMYHCLTGGYGLTEFSPFAELVSWVERGTAPERVLAAGRDPQSGAVTRTRPVFPYPARAAYDGTGSVDDAANFVPAPPLVSPAHDVIDWAGSYLHNLPGPVAR
ncbi:MAG TPA: tannase/feruloyl esterase family alpha/beta hydrolase [Actinophytocola sp.]|uniref:tannase/feruloyl esterase family alpha/beta hydrolase n=1 Tax=Actinophytocola sp. TaxID=1872138 RepID=UPI002DB7F61A|nr:tannase/feruloyl esterase family alpha/beta hydrolase [Actinophytocola sp.]HEU5475024.1 tannase/feruloyl esterase family alpha/beta hydrolase [Actinophytocola sp.]